MNFMEAKYRDVATYRHIVEKLLGRELKVEEVIHHIDGNPLNNSPNNLMVFPNNKEHTQYHYHKLRENKILDGSYKYPNQKALEYYYANQQAVLSRELLKRMELDEGEYYCEKCERNFKNKKSLSNHMRWHKGYWRKQK